MSVFRRLASSLVVGLIICGSVSGQASWDELTFGSSIADVRAVLAKHDMELQRSGNDWIAKPGWDFKPPGLKITLHFVPTLSFSTDEKLDRIILGLQGPQNTVAYYIAATSVREQLVGKYGTPATEAGICTGIQITDFIDNPRKMNCSMVWKAQAQTVRFEWAYDGQAPEDGRFLFSVIYLPVRNGF